MEKFENTDKQCVEVMDLYWSLNYFSQQHKTQLRPVVGTFQDQVPFKPTYHALGLDHPPSLQKQTKNNDFVHSNCCIY